MTVHKKLMDYLARRPHSEKELREKLARSFSPEDVDAALAHAELKGWLQPPHDLSAQVVVELSRRGKGARYIQAYLEEKGLPSVPFNTRDELNKAENLIRRHLHLEPPYPESEHVSILRLLSTRGFDEETARAAANLATSDDAE